MRVISDFPSYSMKGKRYDWDMILDGHTRELERGIDFDCDPSSLVATVRAAARRQNVKVIVRSYVRREDRRQIVAVRAERS
jgi:hypothetical protein